MTFNLKDNSNIEYIVDLAYELHKMAKDSHCPLLALLLKMAVEEGKTVLKKT